MTKKWEDRGRGNLTLRRAKQQPGDSGPNTPFLVFTMESGRSANLNVTTTADPTGPTARLVLMNLVAMDKVTVLMVSHCRHRVLLNASLYKGLSMQQQKAMVLMTLEVADAPG